MTNVILNSIKRLLPQETLNNLGSMVNELVGAHLTQTKEQLTDDEKTTAIVLLKAKDDVYVVDATFAGNTMKRELHIAKLTDYVNKLVNQFLCSSKI